MVKLFIGYKNHSTYKEIMKPFLIAAFVGITGAAVVAFVAARAVCFAAEALDISYEGRPLDAESTGYLYADEGHTYYTYTDEDSYA